MFFEKDARVHELAKILSQHKIKNELKEDVITKKKVKVILFLLHNKHQIDKCDFDRQLQFKDSLFYDISAWSFDLTSTLKA
jgi:hypothetical protein